MRRLRAPAGVLLATLPLLGGGARSELPRRDRGQARPCETTLAELAACPA